MRAFFAASLPQHPYLLGVFVAVLILFAAVLYFSLRPGQGKELERSSRLPLND